MVKYGVWRTQAAAERTLPVDVQDSGRAMELELGILSSLVQDIWCRMGATLRTLF
jgi:hypothetical protein